MLGVCCLPDGHSESLSSLELTFLTVLITDQKFGRKAGRFGKFYPNKHHHLRWYVFLKMFHSLLYYMPYWHAAEIKFFFLWVHICLFQEFSFMLMAMTSIKAKVMGK